MTSAQPSERKGAVEKLIEALAGGAGNSVAWLAEHGVLFVIFAALWLIFAASLVWSQDTLDQAWQTIRELPLITQIVLWVLFLPVMIGLWVWETTWPFVVRVALIVGLAGWNLFVFLPRALQAPRP